MELEMNSRSSSILTHTTKALTHFFVSLFISNPFNIFVVIASPATKPNVDCTSFNLFISLVILLPWSRRPDNGHNWASLQLPTIRSRTKTRTLFLSISCLWSSEGARMVLFGIPIVSIIAMTITHVIWVVKSPNFVNQFINALKSKPYIIKMSKLSNYKLSQQCIKHLMPKRVFIK